MRLNSQIKFSKQPAPQVIISDVSIIQLTTTPPLPTHGLLTHHTNSKKKQYRVFRSNSRQLAFQATTEFQVIVCPSLSRPTWWLNDHHITFASICFCMLNRHMLKRHILNLTCLDAYLLTLTY